MDGYRLKEPEELGVCRMKCDLASQFSSTVFTFSGTRASQLTGFQITTLRVNQIEFNFITQLILILLRSNIKRFHISSLNTLENIFHTTLT